MKKLGQINDAHLLKKAAGNTKAENGVKQLIAGKIAMFDTLLTEAEKVSLTKMNKEARAALIEAAASYMPASQMLEPAEKVFKQAQALLSSLFMEGMKKKGGALIDHKATAYMKKQAQITTQNVQGAGISSELDGSSINYDGSSGTNDENAIADQLFADSFEGTPETSTYNEGEIPTDEIMQLLAQGESSLNDNTDLNIPYPDVFNIQPGAMSVEAQLDLAERASALRVLKKAEQYLDSLGRKNATDTMEVALPTGDSGSTAEATEKEFNADVKNNPKVESAAAAPAGDDMNALAEVTELSSLLDESAATGTDQTNPATSVNPAETPKSKEAVASANNIFKDYLKNLK